MKAQAQNMREKSQENKIDEKITLLDITKYVIKTDNMTKWNKDEITYAKYNIHAWKKPWLPFDTCGQKCFQLEEHCC